MSTPQQPELARSKRTPVSPRSTKASARAKVSNAPASATPVPDDNQPGHHPPVEQDKPAQPPSLPARHHRFAFTRELPLALASLPFGVTGERAFVEVDDENLQIRFGPWTLSTPMTNVEHAERTGPYRWWKVGGPARLSLRDSGVTFATAMNNGVCITFREPVPAALPNSRVRHRAATVTVDDPDDLVRFINQAAE